MSRRRKHDWTAPETAEEKKFPLGWQTTQQIKMAAAAAASAAAGAAEAAAAPLAETPALRSGLNMNWRFHSLRVSSALLLRSGSLTR